MVDVSGDVHYNSLTRHIRHSRRLKHQPNVIPDLPSASASSLEDRYPRGCLSRSSLNASRSTRSPTRSMVQLATVKAGALGLCSNTAERPCAEASCRGRSLRSNRGMSNQLAHYCKPRACPIPSLVLPSRMAPSPGKINATLTSYLVTRALYR